MLKVFWIKKNNVKRCLPDTLLFSVTLTRLPIILE